MTLQVPLARHLLPGKEFTPTKAEVEKNSLALLALAKSKNKPDEAHLLRRLTYKELKEFAKLIRKKMGGGKKDED